tara:strand:+ start:795 stop:1307 length:513 start_codon:yes stop_codon:yes gene_type:complete
MSLIAMQGGATGTGTVTLLAPVTNTNRTLTLPDATGTVQVSGTAISGTTASFSGDVTLGSSVLATPTGTAPSYLCRAWVNFNGTGTVAIRASGNVSSITDNGTGNYTVNFATAMPDANYSFLAGAQANGIANGPMVDLYGNGATGSAQFRVFTQASAVMDSPVCTFAAFR